MKKLLIFSYLLSLGSTSAKAQNTLPNTDIFLLDMKQENGQYTFSKPVNITNRAGYDNQPYFTPDGKSIYYSSIRENKNADVYRYDISSGKTEQFTNTPTDEYSPQLTPDGKYISVVRVEKDSEQRIWLLPLEKRKKKEHVIMPNIDSVGYYTWGEGYNTFPTNHKCRLLFYINIKKPQSLYFVNINLNKSKKVLEGTVLHTVIQRNVALKVNHREPAGRSLQTIDSSVIDYPGNVYFVKTTNDSSSWICFGWSNTQIIQLPKGTQDFALGPDNTIYMGSEGKLYKYKQGTDKNWVQIADFSNSPVKDFYRLAINKKGDRIALVSFTGAKP